VPTSSASRVDAPRLVLTANHAAFLVSHRLPVLIRAREAGWHVTAAAAGDSSRRDAAAIEELKDNGIDFFALPITRAGRSVRRELLAYQAMRALYLRIQPSVVHHVTIKPVIYGSRAAQKSGVPAVLNAVSGLGSLFLDHSLLGRLQRRVVVAMYRRALLHPNVMMLFQNHDDAKTFASLELGRHARQAVIGGSGVDLTRFVPTAEPVSDAPIVVLPARLIRDKGVYEFVEAARRIRAQGVGARFVLAGGSDSNPTAIASDTLEQWRREGVVECWGHRDDMPKVLAQSAIVCLPSYREGFPKALLEAAACARPIVTTDVPGCRDAVTEATGLLVPPRNASALGDALLALLSDPAKRSAMGAAARKLAERSFGVDAVTAQTIALYHQLLQ
jgi:glycosyltransferase involved in cell wall biosynthesis